MTIDDVTKEQEKESKEEVDLELRPHHVTGYFLHEEQPEFYSLSNSEYIRLFREGKQKENETIAREQGLSEDDIKKAGDFVHNFHSDELIVHWKNTVKRLHDNPDLKFKYVPGLDSVCKECDKQEGCHDEKHWQYEVVQAHDKMAIDSLPELKFGKVYDGHYLNKLFVQKGRMKEAKFL
jgi:hypothetical protein